MDALSEVLTAVKLTGAVFLEMTLRARWSYITAPARAIADVLMPEADHVIPYHLITSGTCYARLLTGEPVGLESGDVILFPAGDQHVLAGASRAALALKPVDLSGQNLHAVLTRGNVAPFASGKSGPQTGIVCGFLACDGRLAEPLIRSLPRMLKVTLRDSSTGEWVRSSIRYSVTESAAQRPGSAMVLARLSEVLFAEAIRQYMDSIPEGRTGWLSALRDRQVGRTLALLHDNPARNWSVESLARRVGLSRSALGERFNTLVGAPPMHYLTRWRMSLAASKLRQSDAPIIEVASAVGYESEAAFNRAFKREFGMPPARWRRQASAPA